MPKRYGALWRVIGWGIFLLGFGYLLTKAFAPNVASVDLKFLWLAGVLWSEGTSPYGPEYLERAREIFVDTNVPVSMLYPPYWYPFARFLALFPIAQAEQIWGGLSLLMILGGAALILLALRSLEKGWGSPPVFAFLVFLAASSPTAQALAIGQTSPILLLGVGFFLHALATGSRGMMCVALMLLMLKPHFGLPLAVFALLSRGFGPATILAAVAATVMALPALLPYGGVDVISNYVSVLGGHDDLTFNAPPALTGAVNVAHHLFGLHLTVLALVGAATVVAAFLAIALRRESAGSADRGAKEFRTGLVLLLVTVFLVPLHTYDLLLIAPVLLLPLMGVVGSAALAIGVICAVILFRPNNFADIFGLVFAGEDSFSGSGLASVALLLLLVLVLAFQVAMWRTGPPAANRIR